MKYAVTPFLVIFILSAGAFSQNAPQSRCQTQPEYRQFDFWIGEWEVKNPNDVVVGSSKIELVSGDCLILENWTSSQGTSGKSMNYYSFVDSKWHQHWIGSGGVPLNLSGTYNMEEKAMEYTGESVGPGGVVVQNKLTFFQMSDDYVRQLWEQSSDGGKSWSIVFDGHYHRRK